MRYIFFQVPATQVWLCRLKNFVFQVFFPARLWLCRAELMLPDDQRKDKRKGGGAQSERRISA